MTPNPGPEPARGRHPYYIVAPPYRRTSAGVRVLHLLCHHLNIAGERAYMLRHLPAAEVFRLNPDLLASELNSHIADFHFQRGATPIVVLPEIVPGDPFGAPVRVRYYLNFPGLLGGDETVDPDELNFGYSKALADSVGNPQNVLLLPVVDTRVYQPAPEAARKGTCYYARKFKENHGGRVFGLPPGCVEISSDRADSPEPHEIADLFRRSEFFYCFENSSLIIEAGLCGCPSVLMQNEYLGAAIAEKELGWDGVARGPEPGELERAKRTVGNVTANYHKVVEEFRPQLDHFIKVTQARAAATPYAAPLGISKHLGPVPDLGISLSLPFLGIRTRWQLDVMRDRGLGGVLTSMVRSRGKRRAASPSKKPG